MGSRRERVYEQAVGQLRVMIENGDVQPGERLPPEPELGNLFNMGRSSIREAIRILETEGLVEIRRGTGTFVKKRGEWNSSRNEVIHLIKKNEEALIHLLEVREGLEGIAVSLVAQNPSVDLIGELNQIVEQMAKFEGNDNKQIDFTSIAKLNTTFHLTISRASGNNLVHELILHLLGVFSESNEAILYTGLTVDAQVREHKQIVKAIEDRDPKKAENNMRDHISRVRTEILEMKEE